MKLDQADPVLQVGQENWTRVKNNTGVTISDGTVVYISGVDGGGPSGIPEITPAMSDQTSVDAALGAGDPNPSEILGVTTQEFLDGQEGFVTTFGLVRGLSLATFSAGDIVYLDPMSPGGLTNVEPAAPDSITRVGIVITSGGNGTLLVQVTESTSINDIGGTAGFQVNTGTLAGGQILRYNALGYFENAAASAGAGYLVGKTIYVDEAQGADATGEPNDPSAAYRNIGAAISGDSGRTAAAAAGDTIVVMPGEYPEEGIILPDGVSLVGTGGWGQTFIGSVDAQRDILTLGRDCYLNGVTCKVPHKQYVTSVALTQPAGTNGTYNINFEGENRSDIYAKLVLTSNFLAGAPGSGDRIWHETGLLPDGGPLSMDFNYCFVSSLTVGQHTEAGVVEVLIGGTAQVTLQNLIAAINDDGGVGQNGVDGSGRYQYNQLGGANTNTGPNPYLTAAFESGSTNTVIFTTTQEFGALGSPTQLYVIENIADAGSAGSIFPGIPVNDFGWGTSWPPSSNDGDFPGTGVSLGTAPYNNGVVSAASYITYALGTAMFRSGGGKTIGANIRVEKGGMEDIFRCDQGVLALEGTHVPFSPGRTVNKLRTTVKAGISIFATNNNNLVNSDDFDLDASSVGGNNYNYNFVPSFTGTVGTNAIEVLIGADLTESLENLIAAINNTENLVTNPSAIVTGIKYAYGPAVGEHDTVKAVYTAGDGVTNFGGIRFEYKISGAEGTTIELNVAITSGTPRVDFNVNGTLTSPGATTTEPFVLLAAGRTQFLNFNCGDPNLENAIKVDGGSSDAQPACLVFTPNIFNCTNAIHSDGKYQSTNLLGGRIENVTYAVRVLDGSASAGVLTQAEAEGAKFRISANHQPDYFYPPESAQYSDFVLNYSQETTDTRDASYNIFGQEQLSVGFSERGADSHFGKGAPYQAGMAVLTSDAVGTLIEVNNEPANSKSGSTFTFPGQTVVPGLNPVSLESILLGSLRRTADPDEPLKFWGAEIDVASGEAGGGGWEYLVQRWHNPFLRLQQGGITSSLMSKPDVADTMVVNLSAVSAASPTSVTINFVTAGGGALVAVPANDEINVYIGTQTSSHEAFTSLVNALTNAEFIAAGNGGVTYAYGANIDYETVIEPYLDARFQATRFPDEHFVEFISKEPQSAGIITVQYNVAAGSLFSASFIDAAGSETIISDPGGGASFLENLEEGWYETKYHVTSSAEGYSYGDTLFYRDNSSEKIRFGIDSSSYWLPTTITPTQDCAGCNPSGLVGVPLEAYWIRIVNTNNPSAVALPPTIERIKLIESATNISKNGVLSCTGLAQFRRNISLNGNIFAGRGGGATLGDNDTGNFYLEPYTIGGTAAAHLIPNSVLDNVNGEIMVQFPLPSGISTAFPLTISMYFQYGSSGATPGTYLPCDIILNAKALPVSGVLIADDQGALLPVERNANISNQFNSGNEMYDTKRTVAPGVATNSGIANVIEQVHKLTFNPIDISKYYEGDVVAIKFSLGEDLNAQISLWSVDLEGVQFQAGQSI
jgi:hypothetical protein